MRKNLARSICIYEKYRTSLARVVRKKNDVKSAKMPKLFKIQATTAYFVIEESTFFEVP